jgi:phytoene/squalene synthetase
MSDITARAARKITWASSKQSYLTAVLLADRDLVDDCLRAYAYFRWADDTIDLGLLDRAGRSAFIERQKSLIDRLYRREQVEGLCPEEHMLAELIAHDRGTDSGLHSFIYNFMAVIAFDVDRQGRPVSRQELSHYTSNLATAVMDGLQYFIGNGHPYPKTHARTLAVTGAHITHMLRDTQEDLAAGIVNVPEEYLNSGDDNIYTMDGERFPVWAQQRVKEARACFRAGKAYIDSLDVLRCKLAGIWYCARFECVLAAIERDLYRLRSEYPERHSLRTWLKMFELGFTVTVSHLAGRMRSPWVRTNPQVILSSKISLPSYRAK